MALVDYSGSESDSDNDEKNTTPDPAKPKPTYNKPVFQKVVDRSNPHKIKVSLPEPARAPTEDGNVESGPPAKRVKIGAGGMSGFNSFLPAPKRTAAPGPGSGIGSVRRGGLGSGINLKTRAAPGFSREPAASVDESSGWDEGAEGGSVMESPVPDAAPSSTNGKPNISTPELEIEPKKKSTMFKPLSVANRKYQKKRVPPADSLRALDPTNREVTQPPKVASKVSLFSTGDEQNEASSNRSATKGTYQPLVYHADKPTIAPATKSHPEEPNIPQDYTANSSNDPPNQPTQPTQPQSQSLSAIATDLNLSASAKRQLLGRHHKTDKTQPSTAPTIVNFNTDEEYAANELLRQAGETVQHNPVRGIVPGKHSLKQLVNAASNQKDALEEQFASGRRNKKEAGSKYGW